ncbi:MAG: M1 family metallopeptidase [Chitinophagaceae bacterium]
MLFFIEIFLFQASAQNLSSKYDPHELFAPSSYPNFDADFRNAAGEPGIKYWQNKADYQIDAILDEEKNEIKATVTLTYKNNSPYSISYLWLILEQNLFNPSSRGFAKIPATSRSRYGNSANTFEGGFHFQSVKQVIGSEKSILLNVDTLITDTRMQVRLSSPLASKGELKLRFQYTFTPPVYGADRMGVLDTKNGKIFAIAQWYPRVCVYDDVRGWNADPYLGPSEFYLEYGDYNVNITAPSSHVIVGSGELLNPQEVLTANMLKKYNEARNSSTTVIIRSADDLLNAESRLNKPVLTWKFNIKNARDFTWASSSSFIWDGARIDLPSGKKSFAMSAYPIESKGVDAWSRSTEYVKTSIQNYSKRWFEYPYPAAINVASNVGGMEYPGIVFCGSDAKGEGLWGVTDHELGHTWFPMIVGNNERRYGWMDEGFNTFINAIASGDFNNGEFQQGAIDGHAASAAFTAEAREKIMLTPDAMKEANIGINLYAKPGYALTLLRERILGQKRFDYAFRKYINDWSFKHPTPWDFFRSIDNSSGEDLYWFWKSWFLENYKLDQAIQSVSRNENGILITVANLEKMALPIEVLVSTASGEKIRKTLPIEVWQNNITYTFRMNIAGKVIKVEIDPDKAYPDSNPANNVWIGEQ